MIERPKILQETRERKSGLCSKEAYQSARKSCHQKWNVHKLQKQRPSTNFCGCQFARHRQTKNSILEHLKKLCSTFRKTRKAICFEVYQQHEKVSKNWDVISLKEVLQVECWLFKCSQQTLHKKKPDRKLTPSKDEQGLFRAHGRLENIRSLPNDLRNPIVLLKGHPLVFFLHLN